MWLKTIVRSAALMFHLAHVALIGWVVTVAAVVQLPLLSIVALVGLGVSLLFSEPTVGGGSEKRQTLAILGAWGLTVILLASLISAGSKLRLIDAFFAPLTWMIALTVGLTAVRDSHSKYYLFWKLLFMTWAFLGEFVWAADAYLQDRSGDFFIGIIIALGLLIGMKLWFRLPGFLILATNTLIVTLIFLPVLDWAFRPAIYVDPSPNVAGDGYLYETAKRNPAAYERYWKRYIAQYDRIMRELFFADKANVLPFRVRTNSQSTFFQSRICMNSRGFRGKEISSKKGRIYRIVALGESNTFGFTLTPEHKPWPEFLEQIIQDRLHPTRPVEVINAGLPHHSLEDNLTRLRLDILSLEPDMIISYHGWNGFPWLYPELPPVAMKYRPIYHHRPLRLFAEAEYRFQLIRFRRKLRAPSINKPPSLSQLLTNRYADAYRALIHLARANNIRLVLGNYSMAVNARSQPEVVDFYRGAFPSVNATIKVNEMHSMLVEELVRQHPEVHFVDTHPHLDGQHQKFIDLVHFAPSGDLQLAETFFESIRNILESDLASRSSAIPETISQE